MSYNKATGRRAVDSWRIGANPMERPREKANSGGPRVEVPGTEPHGSQVTLVPNIRSMIVVMGLGRACVIVGLVALPRTSMILTGGQETRRLWVRGEPNTAEPFEAG